MALAGLPSSWIAMLNAPDLVFVIVRNLAVKQSNKKSVNSVDSTFNAEYLTNWKTMAASNLVLC